jgi:hypothetical protein
MSPIQKCGTAYDLKQNAREDGTPIRSRGKQFWSHLAEPYMASPNLHCCTPWVRDQPVARPLSKQDSTKKQNKRRQTSMPQVGFGPMIPVFERAKIVHASDRAATVIGITDFLDSIFIRRREILTHCDMTDESRCSRTRRDCSYWGLSL